MKSTASKALLASFPLQEASEDRSEGGFSGLMSKTDQQFESTSMTSVSQTLHLEASAQNSGTETILQTRTIETSFVYPIDFQYEPPDDERFPCHWCKHVAYGIVGLGKRKVMVVTDAEGKLQEISGGHSANGHEPSRMCAICALERIRIMKCAGHRIVPLKGLSCDTFDFAAAYKTLESASGEMPDGMPVIWCSLCPHPAFFGCNTAQPANIFLGSAQGEAGCGLFLCEACEDLVGVCEGNLAEIVERNELEDPESGKRADLTVTTSSTKRRKVAEPRRPGTLPGLSFASQTGRRHGHPSSDHSSSSSALPHRRPSPTSPSNRSQSSSASPPPRYIPAHLQDEVLGTRSQPSARSPTLDSTASAVDCPSAACAGLTLHSDPATDMSASDEKMNAPGASDSEKDVVMDQVSTSKDGQPHPAQPDTMDTSGSGDDNSTGNEGSSPSDNVYPTPSSMSTYTAPTETRAHAKAEASVASVDPPSFDDQVAQVTKFMMQPMQEKQKGYVVSMSWLKRVFARSSTHADQADKTAAEGEIGPVDNSDIVLVTDPAIAGFKDENGEPFVPLRPGLQIGEDFEIIPEGGWDLIMQWYGLAEQSPAIVRYAHNTAPAGDGENIQYEINPPIFTILKLTNPSTGTTPKSLKEKNMLPVRALASRHTNFQKWLKQAKELAKIDMSTKVRVWRILGGLGSATTSAAVTPAASRTASPAPSASTVPTAGGSLVLDLNTFLSLSEGSQRELLEEARDQTANSNYNGRMTLDLAGLGGSDIVVLEERLPGKQGDWVSEASRQALNRLGVPSGSLKNEVSTKVKTKSPATSGRSSPVPEPVRGRRKDGKPRGCTGLSNLGNTCYMNSALQCVRSVEELTYYFLNDVYKKDLNPSNPLAHNGDVAKAYANLLRQIFDEAGQSSFAPRQLKQTIGRYGPAFSGYGQQDSQEFLLFLLDGLQEDLNRIQKKPYIEKPDSTDDMVHDKAALKEFADKCWDIYKARNDSVITDLFAGMYKSTLVCPVCDKVSIIFDPFNNLTLQLPIENLWSKEIFYFPLNKKPVIVDVEIDKHASIKSLKELVAKKMGSDPQRLVMSEIYKHKFYKMFDNTSSIADCQISNGDDLAIYEVESVPTNYNPDKQQKSYFSFNRSEHEEIPKLDSPRADRLLVPIFNRFEKPRSNNPKNTQRPLFGVPSYVVINREELGDYDAIFRKVLAQVASMSTRDFLSEVTDAESSQEDSDTVVMNEDDAQSADSKIKTSSVDGEDGIVDVSMRDADDSQDDASAQREGGIPTNLRNLFEMKIIKSNEVVPLGFSSVDDHKEYPRMSFRIKTKPAPKKQKEPESETATEKSDDESAGKQSSESAESDIFADAKRPVTKPNTQIPPMIRPGEGIVVDWTEDAYDALFSGGMEKDSVRGSPTWTNIERHPDPELSKKRALRQTRKKRGVTLYECLDEFNKEEILSENDAWYCPRCKEHRRASKKFELWKTPDILVMHLKRFSASRGFRDKLDVLVDFPVEGLDMSGRVEAPEDGKSLIYDLFAVDNHYGGLGGGHYTAYAKNFMTGQWNEYNDSSVSRPLDPQSVVTPSAYLLFYRRRSERPLGGKVLGEITEASTRPGSDADSQSESRGQSPSGEGRRLGGSSRNGSSSALTGVGAAHQLGDGGLRTGTRTKSGDEDSPPEYSSLGKTTRQEGMDFEDEEFGPVPQPSPFRHADPPSWSFSHISDAHGSSQMTTAQRGSISDDDDLPDDNDSNKAVGGGDVSDTDLRMAALTDSPRGGLGFPGTPMEETSFQELHPFGGDGDDDDEDDLPVVELQVNDEDRVLP
ncbi:putative ubiquitin-specific protease UBP12 [Aspergillus homomorphus CBS 101889]|uniref:ubiquitinyl hydrolase 1 n=1 Tax=Aspergillus homomorphus (strain CBS 101889) TaxID=1450537 RepID=A0A395I0X2_ASPHC|nr:UCH-domain-containing protein [Aspergillus homomorphus CBS 101889]RAL13841.1 UCH-domain-containing protein [Aspergillus homomorphus CBS 101889]